MCLDPTAEGSGYYVPWPAVQCYASQCAGRVRGSYSADGTGNYLRTRELLGNRRRVNADRVAKRGNVESRWYCLGVDNFILLARRASQDGIVLVSSLALHPLSLAWVSVPQWPSATCTSERTSTIAVSSASVTIMAAVRSESLTRY